MFAEWLSYGGSGLRGSEMNYKELMDKAHLLIQVHPSLEPAQYAALLQHHFQDQPLLGWWLLSELQGITPPPEPEEKGG